MSEKPKIKKVSYVTNYGDDGSYWICLDYRFIGYGDSIIESYNDYERIKNAHLKLIQWADKYMNSIYGG